MRKSEGCVSSVNATHHARLTLLPITFDNSGANKDKKVNIFRSIS